MAVGHEPVRASGTARQLSHMDGHANSHGSLGKAKTEFLSLALELALCSMFSKTYIKLKHLNLILNLSSFTWQMYQKILFGYWS